MSVSPANSRPGDSAQEKHLTPRNSHSAHKGTDADARAAGGGNGKPAGEPISDEQLLDAYRQGSKGGFTQLVERYQRELFHFLVRFLGDRAAAEDVFQET